MYLVHQTETEYIKNIFNDKLLKSGNKTNNKGYNPHNYYLEHVYFTTIPRKHLHKVKGTITLVFNKNILLHHDFYINNHFRGQILEDTEKYNTYDTNKIHEILYQIYNKNKNKIIEYSDYQKSHEIFIKKDVTLDLLKYIIIEYDNPERNFIENKISKYPHLELIIR